jgi:hypothetical protein
VPDLNAINQRYLIFNLSDKGGVISVKKFGDIEKYFSELEKGFEISTFVNTNNDLTTIDPVLEIGMNHLR